MSCYAVPTKVDGRIGSVGWNPELKTFWCEVVNGFYAQGEDEYLCFFSIGRDPDRHPIADIEVFLMLVESWVEIDQATLIQLIWDKNNTKPRTMMQDIMMRLAKKYLKEEEKST